MNKNKTTEQFIKEAITIHGDKYDYSKVVYINAKTKVIIICSQHGEFEQTPNNHLSKKHDCKKCSSIYVSDKNRKSITNFINEANIIHNYKYVYNNMNYTNNHSKIQIKCKIHGAFTTTPNLHLKYKIGCKKCKNKQRSISYIKKVNILHNYKYTYFDIDESKNRYQVITINCLEHGIFKMCLNSHLKGFGCKKCSGYKMSVNYFIEKSNIIHNKLYDYSTINDINYNTDKVEILCKKHGIFKQTVANHLYGKGCPKCKRSNGEIEISNYLENNNISYVSEKKFNECIYKKQLKTQ